MKPTDDDELGEGPILTPWAVAGLLSALGVLGASWLAYFARAFGWI